MSDIQLRGRKAVKAPADSVYTNENNFMEKKVTSDCSQTCV